MHRWAGREAFELHALRLFLAHEREAAGAVAARAPAARGVLHIGEENVAAPLEPERDGIRRAPFVECPGIEKAQQYMELLPRADDLARSSQRVIKGVPRNRLRIIRGLGRRHDETAHLSGHCTAYVLGRGEPKVLPDRA